MNVAERDKLLFTIREVEDTLGVSRATVYNLIAKGHLQRVKVGKSARIPRSSVEEFVTRLKDSAP